MAEESLIDLAAAVADGVPVDWMSATRTLGTADERRLLDGLKLIGFGVWSRQDGKRLVTFPARQFTVDGERRSFSLLRAVENPAAQARLRAFVMQAYMADVQEEIEGVATS